mgnify:CR=1 FL=1
MENIPTSVINLIVLFIVMLLVLLLFFIKNKLSQQVILLQQQMQNQELMLIELSSLFTEKNAQFKQYHDDLKLENEQVTKQLAHRIKVIQEKLDKQIHVIEQQLNQQPEDKLYSRAQKLVELGADITEIMRECDIPRPEAEMLLAVHSQKSSSN